MNEEEVGQFPVFVMLIEKEQNLQLPLINTIPTTTNYSTITSVRRRKELFSYGTEHKTTTNIL
jgi:hypothetical protein